MCSESDSPVFVYNPDPTIVKLVDKKDPTSSDIPLTSEIDNQVTYTLIASNI